MTEYKNQQFTGERALFNTQNALIDNCKFFDGESPLKESSDLQIKNTEFSWKYPVWYSNNVVIEDSILTQTARSGIWYTNNILVKNTKIIAPKQFRRCDGVKIENVRFENALETLWNCKNIEITDTYVNGDYLGLNSQNIVVNNLTLDGNYLFDGSKNITVNNSTLNSKDAFWNCENVVVKDSYIKGEYLCWNTKNIKFINCIIESEQGMCYVDNLELDDCKLLNTTLAFEYSTVDANIKSSVDSIKNPNGGIIKAKEVKEIIFDDNVKTDKSKTIIEITK